MAAGRLAAALVTIMKGTADRTAFRLIPRFLLTTAFGLAISRTKGRPVPAGVISPRDIISTVHNDAQTVLDAAGPLDRFADLPCEVLLLGGSMSARNLAAPLDGLSAVLPRADRVTLPRAGHTAPSNNGKPQLVAAHLRAFFQLTSQTGQTSPRQPAEGPETRARTSCVTEKATSGHNRPEETTTIPHEGRSIHLAQATTRLGRTELFSESLQPPR